ncbi:MAG TPA: sigma-70 family RNA polymerase sigma factor [Solirubrobacterales bacterium]|nr:sigma-70 family RNA polymerase sigma factor [Solirubrobacterales bacterium]
MTQAEHVDPAFRAPDPEIGVSPERDLASRKRAAIELIRGYDPALRSSARRYSICSEDAEDAYQRGIEILLSKAPTTDPRQLLPWTRTVIKHEALLVRRQRERILGRPASASREDDSEDWVSLIPSTADSPDERAVKREKVARSREALSRLKPQELKALTMLAEGYSYAEIAAINEWTRTKVNRCLAEGRQSFRSKFRESEAGDRCEFFQPLISASCDGEADPDELEAVEIHLAACGHCRATLRAYRAAPKAAIALFPALPLGRSLFERAQEAFVSAQTRFNGLGGSDAAVSSVAIGGGARGAGAAALAKLATVCVGAAGGAACLATGVLPAPALLPGGGGERAISTPAPERPTPAIASPVRQDAGARPQSSGEPSGAPSREDPTAERNRVEPAPKPTPTENEFTPEAAGTPVQPVPPAAAPAPAVPPPAVPVGGGGGEFGP